MIGKRIGPYEIIEEVGKGGMATVYRAYQPAVDRNVAIKVIHRNILNDSTALARFQREARLIARLEHAHILPVYDFDSSHDPPYIVMRYLDSGTLKDAMRGRELPANEVAYIFRQIAGALDYAHRNGVIHRDIKPSNIMVDREGNVFVTDFGIARMVHNSPEGMRDKDLVITTTANTIIGTPQYMAPETAGDEPIDHRIDVYALGVMLFEILSGELPYRGGTSIEIIYNHLHAPIPSICTRRPDLPLAMEDVMKKALAKKPDTRFQSTLELAEAVLRTLNTPQASIPVKLKSAVDETQQMRRLASSGTTGGERDTDSKSTPSEQNRMVTTMYIQAAEFVQLIGEVQGAEAARWAIYDLWQLVETTVANRAGRVFSATEDTLLAVWGAEAAQEDDAERAIRAALDIHAEVRRLLAHLLAENESVPLNIGLHTGTALFSSAEGSEYGASGTAISLANRLAQHAHGKILISHDTFRTVRGVFDVERDLPIKMRGHKEDFLTYLVKAARPLAFRTNTRGVEGVETRLVGRNIELGHLQKVFNFMITHQTALVVTIISEAGLGKSRLLYEFDEWIDLHPDAVVWYFPARATQATTHRPYALLRDMLSFRFEILDNDNPAAVQAKMEAGIAELMGASNEEMAHVVGQLVGFDFSGSVHVKSGITDSRQLTSRARNYFKQLIVSASRQDPVVMVLEDIHWADELSLDLLNELVTEHRQMALMMICLARPSLDKHHATWGRRQDFHSRIVLQPLDKGNSRQLAYEILQKVENVPASLLDFLVERSEGNPFYMEELVKMLIDDRVILKTETEWTVEGSRLENLIVPPTLAGLLQARLDSLLYTEQVVLQRATIFGRIFFDSLIEALNGADEHQLDNVPELLNRLAAREFIYKRETSSFAGSTEYVFAQTMMRDLIYQNLLKRHQRAYHNGAAEWLAQASGERREEFYPLIAEHFEKGGFPEKAARFLMQAGQKSLSLGVYREAQTFYQQSITLLPDNAARAEALSRLGEACYYLGDHATARQYLQEAFVKSRQMNARVVQVHTLILLSMLAQNAGDVAQQEALLNESLPLARATNDLVSLAKVLYELGELQFRFNNHAKAKTYLDESLALARHSGDTLQEIYILNRLGSIAVIFEQLDEAEGYFRECHAKALSIGNKLLAQMALKKITWKKRQ